MPKRTCTIDGCKKPVKARGWCRAHYTRWWRHGNPLSGNTRYATPEEAFAARTKWQGNCLEWTGTKDQKGYGMTRVNGKRPRVHRYAWERVNGPIPDGLQIDHICHNRACVNVEHLRLATRAQNGSNLSGARFGSASGVRNVYKDGNRWVVRIRKGGKEYTFGTYSTVEEAAPVAERARQALFGEFAGRG